MLRKYLNIPADAPTPIPPRQYSWYISFWHVVYLTTLALMMGAMLWNARTALGWREAVLVGLTLAQATLYIKLLIFNEHWPLTKSHLALYFLGSLALWAIEWWLEANYFWLVMAYMGQMFGLLPPLITLPGVTAILALVFAHEADWDLSSLTSGDWFGIVMSWTSFTVMYLFITFLVRTSHQRGKLILELQAAQKELEDARQRDAELAALRERERLARDLHDSLGHALVALSVQLEAIQRLYKVDPERASAQVDELKNLTRAHMDELRRALTGLRAPGLGERPLSQALQTLSVEAGQRANWELACHIAENADTLSPAIAETVWRVAQEALTNIEKHAAARRVQLRLEIQPHAAALAVSDDGRGLPADAEAQPGHYGLRGMRERVEGLGGTLAVNGNGNGTTVEAHLPIL